ncbi:zinc ribbon domain-containing protein [Garciella nitratireducens]|uniref:Predicted nucleic acid-binding protein, contains Zn-ribbon domain n=1 Tax=Garciella nitratireducens DSM 15102 TaxID=1121911 RepID=A0A1T4JS05_9FIRM|nr:C4-type zinc ribbon domain-containing protein [Garciella nitratireducens]RBP45517.1 putative nucleic acid-binding Zn-ribbon protein [Garciella nitratireducens]SJZ32980.1 Predicted nucleic acid-binding protein, contains Zn-ribbon domain [Garciella nitratireducens DSM 15102]
MSKILMLWKLQMIEKKIREIDRQKDLQQIKSNLQQLKKKHYDIKKNLEKEIEQYKEWNKKIVKNNNQNENLDYIIHELEAKLYDGIIHNKKVYEKMEKELEECKRDKDKIESDIITIMYEKEKLENKIKKIKIKLLKIQEKYTKQKEKYFSEKRNYEAQKKDFIHKKEVLLKIIPKPLLEKYREIEKNVPEPIVKLENDLCSYCHMKQSIMLLREIKNKDEIYICESCGRILYREIT